MPLSYYWFNPRGNKSAYYQLSGTSMAAAVVSGAAALLFQADRTLTPNDVKARLMKTAAKSWRTDGTVPDIYSRGAGYLDIPAALQCSDRVTAPALSPTCSIGDGIVTIDTGGTMWSDQALWCDVGPVAVQGE